MAYADNCDGACVAAQNTASLRALLPDECAMLNNQSHSARRALEREGAECRYLKYRDAGAVV